MSEIYREAEAAPPGIEPGEAGMAKAHETLQNKPNGAESELSAGAVSSLQKPLPSTMSGTGRGPVAPIASVARYLAERECTPGQLTKMVAVREGRPATVYFVQGVDGGPIKIGHTNKLAYRLDTLQAHSPVKLRLLGTMASTIEMELALHAYFTASRLHGEWFRPTPELLAFIAEFAKPTSSTPIGDSSSGRTAAFEAANPGSIPGSPAVPDEGSFNGRTASSDLADVGSIPAPSADTFLARSVSVASSALALRDAYLAVLGRQHIREYRPWDGGIDFEAELARRLGGRPSGTWTAEDVEADLASRAVGR